ncbi:unnamed protein product [Periconia digitata]|uniref:Rhodopsin domain-containing protein n=1 Tax=Periconia digitata TaxID=1303443 RepID=A0A9W4XMY9_9PLEO|nr:unnamed protein product [Periconia digitata]
MFGIATSCFLGRLFIRLITRKPLLRSSIKNLFAIVLTNAIFEAPEIQHSLAILPYIETLMNYNSSRMAFGVLSWTTIYMIKFTFFAFFKPLVRNFRSLTIYYWCCFGFTAIAYYISFSSLAMNRHNHARLSYEWYNSAFAFNLALALVDIISDIMIVSIPLLLLRNSTIALSKKIGIASFLSLSIFMIVCSIIRAAGFLLQNSYTPNLSWRYLWEELEGCTAVTMASVVAFRTLLVSKHKIKEPPRAPSFVETWYRNRRSTRKRSIDGLAEDGDEHVKTLGMPSATFGGVHSHIRRSHSDGKAGTGHESEFDPLEGDYHAKIRVDLSRHTRT